MSTLIYLCTIKRNINCCTMITKRFRGSGESLELVAVGTLPVFWQSQQESEQMIQSSISFPILGFNIKLPKPDSAIYLEMRFIPSEVSPIQTMLALNRVISPSLLLFFLILSDFSSEISTQLTLSINYLFTRKFPLHTLKRFS